MRVHEPPWETTCIHVHRCSGHCRCTSEPLPGTLTRANGTQEGVLLFFFCNQWRLHPLAVPGLRRFVRVTPTGSAFTHIRSNRLSARHVVDRTVHSASWGRHHDSLSCNHLRRLRCSLCTTTGVEPGHGVPQPCSSQPVYHACVMRMYASQP